MATKHKHTFGQLYGDVFAQNILRAMAREGISQRQLAELAGLHFTTVNRVLCRRADPSLEVCEMMATAMGMSARQAFWGA